MTVCAMEPSSNLDHTLPENGAAAVVPGVAPKRAGLHSRQAGDGGRSLAEMAQRDLDAALQLLADRAQYITGASGAAIALRRSGKNDMLCRASTGPNAPELGALLSTEFGLSGESVRTRQALRCDDAERDIRVNREVCRQMGIASVVVMPVVNDDEVLGVFELFSGKANAFGARDVSAVQRLSEMVETAVRLAQATETLPQRLKVPEASATEVPQVAKVEVSEEDQVLDRKVLQDQDQVLEAEVVEDLILQDQDEDEDDPVLQVATEDAEALADEERSIARLEAVRDSQAKVAGNQQPAALQDPIEVAAAVSGNRDVAASEPVGSEAVVPKSKDPKVPLLTPAVLEAEASIPAAKVEGTVPAETAKPKKLFWSAAMNPGAEAERPEELDQSHVPPVLRTLRKCEACGFPVSAGRLFCVECEEKKWRGQLKAPKAAAKGEVRAFAAAARSTTASGPALAPSPSTSRASAPSAGSAGGSGAAVARTPAAKQEGLRPAPAAPSSHAVARETRSSATPAPVAQSASAPASGVRSPEFVLSAGMQPSQSWLAAHKYIVGVILVVGAAIAAVFLLR
jgi:GAF domain-containing protein